MTTLRPQKPRTVFLANGRQVRIYGDPLGQGLPEATSPYAAAVRRLAALAAEEAPVEAGH